MTIIYEGKGDILTYNAQTLVCTVNCKGAMGAGLALQFKNMCPGLNKAYQAECFSKRLTVESIFLYKPTCGPFVLCLPTKDDWKDDSKIEYVKNNLKNLSEQYRELGITSIAIPPLGCGLGKLDYLLHVRPLLYRYLDPIDLPVSIVLADSLYVAKRQY